MLLLLGNGTALVDGSSLFKITYEHCTICGGNAAGKMEEVVPKAACVFTGTDGRERVNTTMWVAGRGRHDVPVDRDG